SAWIADSRPEPGPWTFTWTRRTPSESASRAHCSAATVAAKGVDFFDPLKPALPAVPQATALPCAAVIVMSVLLKVALTCATPSASTTFLVFFPIAITWSPSSCPRSRGAAPSSCGRWCAYAAHGPAAHDGGGGHGTSRCP